MAKKIGRFLLVALIVLALSEAVFIYSASLKKTTVITSASKDGGYRLAVYMIGEPDWPFGATHCRFDLFRSRKRLIKHPFSIRDDGGAAREEQFHITWGKDHVTVIVSGSEQRDQEYVLNFDGTVEPLSKTARTECKTSARAILLGLLSGAPPPGALCGTPAPG